MIKNRTIMNTLRISDRIRLKNDTSSILSPNATFDESSFISPSKRRKTTISTPSAKRKSIELTDPKHVTRKTNATIPLSAKRVLECDYNELSEDSKVRENPPLKIKNETKRALWDTNDIFFNTTNQRMKMKCDKKINDDDEDDSDIDNDINDINDIKLQLEKQMINNLLNASTEEEKCMISRKLAMSWANDYNDEDDEDEDDEDEDEDVKNVHERLFYKHLSLKE